MNFKLDKILIIKREKDVINMFNEIALNLEAQKEDYLHLKSKVSNTPLKRSIDNILNRIYDDIRKIIKLKGEI
jgi:hypothetical protein